MMIKKTIMIILLLCSQAFAYPVSDEVAKLVGLNFFNSKTPNNYSLSNISDIITEERNNETVFYIINFYPEGWIIISADDIASPVIGFSPEGKYTGQNKPPAFELWMDHTATELSAVIEGAPALLPMFENEWSRFNKPVALFNAIDYADGDDDNVTPLLTTEWNQGAPYNFYCPEDSGGPGGKVWAGCVATAMSQVIKYHNFPETGFGSHEYDAGSYGTLSADFGNTTYAYASMPDGPSLGDDYQDIALLMYHCGISVDMGYSPNGSGANTSHSATNALKDFFKYKSTTHYVSRSDSDDDSSWEATLINELQAGRPIIYRGSGTGGHAFVCDGYQEGSGFHFNWGWSGAYNGYFLIDDMDPGNYNFSNDQGAIIGIKPATPGSLEYPYAESFEAPEIPLECTPSGERVAISTEEARTGLQSLLIGTPNGTGYSLNNAELTINVPAGGAILTFYVKRAYNPGGSPYNKHSAIIKTQFGDTVHHTFFSGNFNDADWQEYSLDLSTWSNTTIILKFLEDNMDSSHKQWMYIDDIEIVSFSLPGDVDGNSDINLIDAVLSLQSAIGIETTVQTSGDVDGDQKIGVAEAVYILQKISGLR